MWTDGIGYLLLLENSQIYHSFLFNFQFEDFHPSWAHFLDMSSPLTSTGPQRKLLGARKRCSNGSVHDQEVSQPSKYFRESGVDRLSKDESKTSKPPASNANHGKEEGCEWFENAFCTRKRSEVCQFLKTKQNNAYYRDHHSS